jgi:hypothetical protein
LVAGTEGIEDPVGLTLLFEDELLLLLLALLLHAAARSASAAAPATQAVRIFLCRKLTAFTYS